MCGIAGFLGQGGMVDLQAMSAALAHRGPDGDGTWSGPDGSVFLAHRRLAVIDITDGGQPMSNADGTLIVVYNGEIYNHVELRKTLEVAGHRFQTDHSDTEVLLHGFREWGEQLPSRLNGMWAFAIYDVPQRRLFLSRDRFGQKPLYYTTQNGTFAFASELSSLVRHKNVQSSVAEQSLQKYFAYGFIPAPHSLYQSVFKLPAGRNLHVELSDLKPVVRQYWDFRIEPCDDLARRDETDLAEDLCDRLRTAVRRRLMSDVPVGLFLSGGIDSSAISRFACDIRTNQPLKSFCVGFDEPDFDESGFAADVAAIMGTNHIETRLSGTDADSLCREVACRIDEPLGDNSIVPTYFLCATARQHVTVALGGDGADELFAGYDTFRAVQLAARYKWMFPRPMHAAIRAVAGLLPAGTSYMSFAFRLDRMLRGLQRRSAMWNPVWLGSLDPAEIEECFLKPADIEDVYSEAIGLWESHPDDNLMDRTTQFYVKLYFQDGILTKLDRAGMLNSLEVRCPFLDTDVVDFARRLPHAMRIRGNTTKYILKTALRPLLPRKVIERKKHGFPFPAAKWFREKRISIDAVKATQWQRTDFVNKKVRQHLRGVRNERMFLWNQWLLNQFLSNHTGR